MKRHLSRRHFLKWLAMNGAGFFLAGCNQPGNPQDRSFTDTPSSVPVSTTIPTIDVTNTVLPVASPSLEIIPSRDIDATATPSPPWNPVSQVATGQAADYEISIIRNELTMMLDALGGLESIVPYGGVVVLKVNLTGGVRKHEMGGLPAVETVATHPVLVRALGELILDAGASELWIGEAVDDWGDFLAWGYQEVAQLLNARLVDLNKPDPFSAFDKVTVPGGNVYQEFNFHPIIQACDTFVSIAKMKCHVDCGVSHSMKNLVGLLPYRLYRLNDGDRWRSGLHGSPEEMPQRLPGVVLDLNLARPIHLAVIDGIKTVQGGEGSWVTGVQQVEPGVMLAGRSAVSTDSIATAIQGFDPVADYPAVPFTQAINYMNLAFAIGLGTNRLDEIEVLGPSLKDLVLPFKPVTG